MVDPDALEVPGNFYVSDALNFIDDRGVYFGEQIEDRRSYALGGIAMHPLLQADPGMFVERETSLHAVQGDTQTQGAAFVNIVGNVDELKQWPDGPLVRLHSACGYSEVGQYITSRLYADPAWLYHHADELLPSFVQYGDGFVAGYPFLDNIEKSTDCDCRAQRKLAQFLIAAAGGIYVSLAGNPQEGRGLGIVAKERLYREQERQERNGLPVDTVAACDNLDLPHDIRNYDHVIAFLKRMGITKVCLLTNNPRKIAAFEQQGVQVTPFGLLPAWLTARARSYMLKKGERLGHNIQTRTEFTFNGGRVVAQNVPAYMESPYIISSSVRIVNSYAIEHGVMNLHDNYPVI